MIDIGEKMVEKMNFSQINVKAAAITGAVIGFLCWLLVIPYGFSGYGLMGNMMGDIFHSYSAISVVLDIIIGAILGAAIGIVYNWALKLK